MRLFILFLALAVPAHAFQPDFTNDIRSRIETAFSPEAGGEALVLKTIDCARLSIRLGAYSFTSPKVVRSLINAKRRGVDVQIVVDGRGNKSKASKAALNLVVNADIPTRMNSRYAIHHDKYVVVDRKHVQTGSFNYSKAAGKSNSENVVVVWNNEQVAASFGRHWQDRFDNGQRYISEY